MVEQAVVTSYNVSMDNCWLYARSINTSGYGCLYLYDPSTQKQRRVLAHRVMYEDANGPIPDGLIIDHLCRNRRCVNPAHLEAVTDRENRRRGFRGVLRQPLTHCKRGHEYTPENEYINPNRPNKHYCRQCFTIYRQARRARLKAAR